MAVQKMLVCALNNACVMNMFLADDGVNSWNTELVVYDIHANEAAVLL